MKIKRRFKGCGAHGKRRIDKKRNKAIALKLRAQGMSFGGIAKHLGIAVGTAYNYVHEGVEEMNEQCKHEAKQLRRIELIRLDKLWAGLERDYKRTKTKESKIEYVYDAEKKKLIKKVSEKKYIVVNYSARAAIIDRMLAVMQERRRYIPGLEVPKESKVGLMDEEQRGRFMEAQETLERRLAQMAGVEAPAVLPLTNKPKSSKGDEAPNEDQTKEEDDEAPAFRTVH
jgi:transposase